MALVSCPHSVVPVRKEPSDRAEQVTQWLFGETAEVIQQEPKWSLLRFSHDGYSGWVDNKQCVPAYAPTAPTAERNIDASGTLVLGEARMLLPLGAVVALPPGQENVIPLSGRPEFVGLTTASLSGPPALRVIHCARPFLGTPYLWGGRTAWGVDCSGFTQMCHQLAGIELPRDAYQQAELGTTVELLDLTQAADLAFFDNEEGRIIHVGLVLPADDGGWLIMHASGSVRIDRLDHQGIYHAQEKRYTHKLRLVKRIL